MESGLGINGDNRGAVSINIKGRPSYIFSRNSGALKAYVVDNRSKPSLSIDVLPNVAKATIKYKDGSERLQEFYYGSSYLSQSSRTLFLNGNESRVVFYDFFGHEAAVHDLK